MLGGVVSCAPSQAPVSTKHAVPTSLRQGGGSDPTFTSAACSFYFGKNKKPWKLQENDENFRNWKQQKSRPSQAVPAGCLEASAAGTPQQQPGFLKALPLLAPPKVAAASKVKRCEPTRQEERLVVGRHLVIYSDRRQRQREHATVPLRSIRPPCSMAERSLSILRVAGGDTQHTPQGLRPSRGGSGVRMQIPRVSMPGLGAWQPEWGSATWQEHSSRLEWPRPHPWNIP